VVTGGKNTEKNKPLAWHFYHKSKDVMQQKRNGHKDEVLFNLFARKATKTHKWTEGENDHNSKRYMSLEYNKR